MWISVKARIEILEGPISKMQNRKRVAGDTTLPGDGLLTLVGHGADC